MPAIRGRRLEVGSFRVGVGGQSLDKIEIHRLVWCCMTSTGRLVGAVVVEYDFSEIMITNVKWVDRL
jgi:hypothetical protein